MSKRRGVTLVELLVVLVVIGLATALVAPSLIVPEPEGKTPIDELLARVVAIATAREQTLELAVRENGQWRLSAASTGQPLADGRWPGEPGQSFALLVSSLGTCGPEPGAALPFELDPLMCEVR